MIRRKIATLSGRGCSCAVILVALGTVSALQAAATELQVGRYSTVRPVAGLAQRDPLAAPVVSALPASVTRIGDAVAILLEPSGYRLSSPLVGDSERAELLNLPLPEAHRVLRPLPLRTALKILAGPTFTLVEDPVHRLISFERCEQATDRR